MINTNIPWVPEINKDWHIQKVKTCFYLSKEKAKQTNPTILSLARDRVKVRDISNNEGQIAASYEDYNPVRPGDLLLNPMDLYSGANCNVSDLEGVISPAYANLRAKIDLSPKFYDYYFKVQYWTMAMFAHGKGVSFDNRWTLNTEGLLNYEIPVPSYECQNKIVEVLNDKTRKIDALIENENKQIEKLEEYKKAIITKAVTKGLDSNAKMKDSGVEWIGEIPEGWKIVPLKSNFYFYKGLPITKENLQETGIKVISYGQIHAKNNKSYKINDELYRFVSPDYLKTNPECLVKKDDFIMADTSEDLEGTGDFVHINVEDTIFAGYHSIILRNKELKNSNYLAFLFLSDTWRNQFRCKVGGVKLFSLTQKILSGIQIIIPTEGEQQKIADYLDKKCESIRKLVEIKKSKIEKLQEYKKSLIYEYVTGKREV